MKIELPEPCLVVLIGATGSGKSTFAAAHFLPTEVISSDFCRGLVADDANDQSATEDAFAVLHEIAGRRLARGRLTVVDATNVQREARAPLMALAREHDLFAVAIVLDVPEEVCVERNAGAAGPRLRRRTSIRRQRGAAAALAARPAARGLPAVVRPALGRGGRGRRDRARAAVDRPARRARARSTSSATSTAASTSSSRCWRRSATCDGVHPDGRRAVFVGDLVDRGPGDARVLRLVMGMVGRRHRDLRARQPRRQARRASSTGRDVQITHGLAESLEQLAAEPRGVPRRACASSSTGSSATPCSTAGGSSSPTPGMPERYQGRGSRRVRDFALYGETTGETDEFGLPVRGAWAADYRGAATVVYGHTPVAEPSGSTTRSTSTPAASSAAA